MPINFNWTGLNKIKLKQGATEKNVCRVVYNGVAVLDLNTTLLSPSLSARRYYRDFVGWELQIEIYNPNNRPALARYNYSKGGGALVKSERDIRVGPYSSVWAYALMPGPTTGANNEYKVMAYFEPILEDFPCDSMSPGWVTVESSGYYEDETTTTRS